MKKNIMVNGEKREIIILKNDGKHLVFEFENKKYEYSLWEKDAGKVSLMNQGEVIEAFVEKQFEEGKFQVFFDDFEFETKIIPKVERKDSITLGATSLQSPMPGKIFKILKNVGDKVVQNDAILIMEAMKMEHTIRAHKDGIIQEIYFKEGEQVQGRAKLAQIE